MRAIYPAILSAALLFTIFSPGAQAQPAGPRDTNRTVYSFSFSPIHQFESDFGQGGSFSVQRYGFNFGTSTPVANSLPAGISLGCEDVQNGTHEGRLPDAAALIPNTKPFFSGRAMPSLQKGVAGADWKERVLFCQIF